jgi:hypothetical protein
MLPDSPPTVGWRTTATVQMLQHADLRSHWAGQCCYGRNRLGCVPGGLHVISPGSRITRYSTAQVAAYL